MRKMTSLDRAIADILRRRRVALGLSPRLIKALSGIEPRDLARYETGSAPIPKGRLFGICRALSITPEDLLALGTLGGAVCFLLPGHLGLDGPREAPTFRRPWT